MFFFFKKKPFKTVLRIWDCLFYEGSKILFRVALTLIRHNQALISQARNLPDICDRFKQTTRGAFVEDCHPFMQVGLSYQIWLNNISFVSYYLNTDTALV